MSTKIKYCGLRDAAMVAHAAAHGAGFIGFVHHAASPRHLGFAEMAVLAASVPKNIKNVAVLWAPEDALLDALLAQYRPDYVQIHGVHDVARIRAIGARGIPLITAIAVSDVSDLACADALEEVSEYVLFDAKQAGAGIAFDWSVLHGMQRRKPWFLAGGLTPENVGEAIAATKAPMVDVSSGIESARGIKSAEKIAAFQRAVLHAAA